MQEIGATLREARMRAKIDVSEVEAATKIRAKYLRAIENEEWDLLPGPTFVKSFLRTYAEYLGIDAKLLVDEFKLRHEVPGEQDLQPIGPTPARNNRRGPRPPGISRGWVVGLCVVGVLALLAVIGLVSDNGTKSNSRRTPPAKQDSVRAVPVTPARPTQVILQLIPQSEVNVCLRDATGKLIVNNEILTPDSPRRAYRSKRFRVTLGNGAIEMRVNGKLLPVPESAEPINYELTPGGRRRLPQSENVC